MPFLRAGEAASEFPEVARGDQLARGGVTARRHGPVIAGCAAAPDPPPRVLAPEPLKLGILAVPAPAGVHGVSLQAAGGRPRGRTWGWGRAGAWMVRAAVQLLPSPLPEHWNPGSRPGRLRVPSPPGSRICGTAHGRTGRQRRSCPAGARARRWARRRGRTGISPSEACSRALALHAPSQPAVPINTATSTATAGGSGLQYNTSTYTYVCGRPLRPGRAPAASPGSTSTTAAPISPTSSSDTPPLRPAGPAIAGAGPSRNNGAKSTSTLLSLWSVSVFGQVNWAGPMPGSRPAWYLMHEYVGRDPTCDLQKLQVAPLTVPLFLEGRTATGLARGCILTTSPASRLSLPTLSPVADGVRPVVGRGRGASDTTGSARGRPAVIGGLRSMTMRRQAAASSASAVCAGPCCRSFRVTALAQAVTSGAPGA